MRNSLTRNRFRIGLALALIAGAILRLIYLWQVSGNPFFAHPIADAAHFDRWASAIANGDLLGTGPFYRAPLYPYLLGFLYWIGDHDFTWVRLTQHSVGLGGVWATAMLARRVWDDRAGIVATWIAALYPTAIFFEGELLSDFLLVTLTPVLLLATLQAASARRVRAALLCGIALGVCAVARPTFLATAPVIVAWVYWGQRRVLPRSRALTRAAVVCLGTALVVLPVTLRNISVGDDAVLIASQGGVNFYIGNNASADGVSAALPPFGTAWTNADATAMAEADEARDLRPSEVSSYWYSQGWDFWSHHPISAARLLIRKFGIFWQSVEFTNNLNMDWFTQRWGGILRTIPLSFGLVVALGAIGWMTGLRASMERRWILGWSLAYAVIVAIFFVVSRLRLPVLPIWIGAAAAGGVWLWDEARQRRWKRFVIALAAAMALFLATSVDWFDLRQDAHPRSFLALANAMLTAGQAEDARAALDSALQIDDDYRGVWLSRGTAFYLDGQLDSAAGSYREELRRHPTSIRALTNLARTCMDRRDTASALDFLDSALALRADDHIAARQKASLLRARGDANGALGALNAAGLVSIRSRDLAPLLGVIFLDLGRLNDAESTLLQYLATSGDESASNPDPVPFVTKSDPVPDQALVYYNLGVIAGYRSEWRSAAMYLSAAVAANPNLGAAWSNLATTQLQLGNFVSARSGAENAVRSDPTNPVYLVTLALANVALADTAAAVQALESALASDSDFAPASELLDILTVRH